MAAFKKDWVDWAANIPSAQASPPRLGIAVHLIMLKSGKAKGLGNFELCETRAHNLLSGRHWKKLFMLSVAESIITAVQANSTRADRNTPESALFGLVFCLLCLYQADRIREYCKGSCAVVLQQNKRHNWEQGEQTQNLPLMLPGFKPQFCHKLPVCLSLSVSCWVLEWGTGQPVLWLAFLSTAVINVV